MDGSGLLGGSPPLGVDEEEEAERRRSLKGLSPGGVEGQANGDKAAPQDGTPDSRSEGPCLPCRLEDTCVISGFCGDRRNGFRTPREWMGVGWTDGGGEEEGGHAVPWPVVLGEDRGMPLALGRVSGTSPGLRRAGGGTELREVPDGLSVHRTGDGGSGDMVVSGPLQINYSCAVLPAVRSSSGGPVSPPELRDANCLQHAEGGSNRRAASPCCREEEHMANGGVHLTCTPCRLPLRTSGEGQGYDPGPPPPVQDSTVPELGLPLHTPCPVSPSDGAPPPSPGTSPPSPGTNPPSPGSSPPSPGTTPPSPGTSLAARPQSLRTCGSTTVSLSCGATPLSPEDGGALSLEAGRRQSAPDPLPDPPGSFAHNTTPSKRSTIAEFFTRSLFSRKSKEPMVPSQNATGWRLFGKAGPESDAGQQRPLPSGRRKQLEFEPQSTTALILEDRPANLPAKCEEEAQRHKQEYQEMVAGARRREMKEAQRRKRKVKERHRQEESISHAITTWNTHILPHWEDLKCTRRVRELWWQGLPPSVRGRVWSLAIGNDLNITPELYDIFLCRVKDRWRCSSETSSVNDSESDGGASLADRESSLDLIKLDISRTFPSLFIFQKGGPYHDVLHSLLGAYTCYRPDIGYVQGMSFMAAVLILNLEEAQAFITFTNLLNKPCQLTFFRVDHDLMLKYFAAFEVFFEENLPRLFTHFLANNLTPDLYLIDWIFTLYSKALPLDVACRVWDVFCRDGEESLFRTALGLLRLYQDVLLQMDFIHMAQFLTRLPPDLPPHLLFSAMANTHMVSRAGRWVQVFSSLMKDGNKETHGSPALRS